MNQFPNIPESVKEDIRKRAEERYPEPDKADFMVDRQIIHIQREAYCLALCEAWEMMGETWDAGSWANQWGWRNERKPKPPNKTEFLNQIFKK